MLVSRVLSVALLAFAFLSGPQHPAGDDPLKRKVSVEPQTARPVDYVASLLLLAGVAGGIEDYPSGCDSSQEIRMPPLDGTLEDGLSQLKGQDNSLRWRVQDDGILVSKNPPATSLLDTKVGDFKFYRHDNAEEPTDRLLSLPIVKGRISTLNLTLLPPEIGFAQARVERRPEDQVVLKDTTLREALNAIARADHPRVWLFEQRPCEGQTFLRIQWLVK